jgi:hypothetical protein
MVNRLTRHPLANGKTERVVAHCTTQSGQILYFKTFLKSESKMHGMGPRSAETFDPVQVDRVCDLLGGRIPPSNRANVRQSARPV